MTAEPKQWRVAVVALNADGLFLIERLSLVPEVLLRGVYDPKPERRQLAANSACELQDRAAWMEAIDNVDVVLLMDAVSHEDVALALQAGKHVVIGQPWALMRAELVGLAQQFPSDRGVVATYACWQRWAADFSMALRAYKGGKLGTLQSIRCVSCEQRIPGEGSSTSALSEFGFPLLDQLLLFVAAGPRRVFAKLFTDHDQSMDHGFLAAIEFANECTAVIEVQTQSRLAHRTGWMLEGSTGSYRNDRLYTMTADGEIVDEPLPPVPAATDPLIPELLSAWRGDEHSLPQLNDAARVMQLVEAIAQSANSGTVVWL